jgi:hypothetical protein
MREARRLRGKMSRGRIEERGEDKISRWNSTIREQ